MNANLATEYHAPKYPDPSFAEGDNHYITVSNYDVRKHLPPDDPMFWGLLQTRESYERQQKVAKGLARWWNEEKQSLPKGFIRSERLNKIFDGWEDAATRYTDVGAADTVGREGVYLLLARHYNVSPDVFFKAWASGTVQIPVNLN